VPGRRGGQRRRLHVGREIAVGGQRGALRPPDQVIGRGDLAGPGPQPGALEFGGQQRSRPAAHRAHFGPDHEVTGAQVRGQPGPDAHDRHRAERAAVKLLGTLRRAAGPISGVQDGGSSVSS
jgi:hypothetical protein